MAKQITKLTASERRRISKNKRAKASDVITLPNGQRYLIVGLALTNDAVPDDYAGLKAHVENHAKVTLCRNLVYGQADTLEEGFKTDLHISVHERETAIPQPVE